MSKTNNEIWKKLRKDKRGTCRKGFVVEGSNFDLVTDDFGTSEN